MPTTLSLRLAVVLGALLLAPLAAKFDVAPLPGTSAGRTVVAKLDVMPFPNGQIVTVTAQTLRGEWSPRSAPPSLPVWAAGKRCLPALENRRRCAAWASRRAR
jgi:hypothetical protein